MWQPEILSRDANCKELGCVFVPLVVEAYGARGMTEAIESLSHLASRLATSSNKAKAVVLTDLYGRLNLNLVRANATAILTRCVAYIYLCILCYNYIYINAMTYVVTQMYLPDIQTFLFHTMVLTRASHLLHNVIKIIAVLEK